MKDAVGPEGSHKPLEGAVTVTTALSCWARGPSQRKENGLSERNEVASRNDVRRWEGALSEFTEMPCGIATAELGSPASPVSGPARSPLRFLLAAVMRS